MAATESPRSSHAPVLASTRRQLWARRLRLVATRLVRRRGAVVLTDEARARTERLPRWWRSQAVGSLLVAGCLRRIAPMERWSPLLGRVRAVDQQRPATEPSARESWISDGLLHARSIIPIHTNCLDHALAATLMARRERWPGQVVIGLRADTPSAAPHAWTIGPDGGLITGGDEAPAFTPVTVFDRPPRGGWR